MDLVHDRGSMDLAHESGPWTRSKDGVHGPLVHVLSSLHLRGFFKGSQMLQLNSEYRSNNGGLEKAVLTFSCILIS